MWPAVLNVRVALPRTAVDRQHTERVLADARALLACGCLVAAWIGRISSPIQPRLILTLLAVYAAEGIAVAVMLRHPRPDQPKLPLLLHGLDLMWAFVLTILTHGPASPFSVLFFFALVAASFRSGLRQTLATASIVLAIILTEALLLDRGAGTTSSLFFGRVGVTWLAAMASYLVVAAVLVGGLAEEGRLYRAELGAIGRLFAGIQAQTGFGAAVRYVAGELLARLGADRIVLVAREQGSGRAIVWYAAAVARSPHGAIVRVLPHTEVDVNRYLFHATGDAWAWIRGGRDPRMTIALDRDAQMLPVEAGVPGAFWQAHAANAAAAVAVEFGRWNGRAFVLRDRWFSVAELRFVHGVVCQVVPAMHNQYLMRRLRSRISTTERHRLARELRDGLVQSLSGLETQMAATRQTLADRDPVVDAQLQRIQRQIGDEARAIRDRMHKIRPFQAAPDQILEEFEEIVERFGRESGITSRFWSEVHDVYLPPKTARELARALQEALANVRKHAAARQVDVRFSEDDDAWRLEIYNDGRPFDFLGRFTLHDLEALRRGPRLMKRRVRGMGADLTIESSPGGVRVDILVPRARTKAS